MTTTKIQGELEIDHERGVIYFHNDEGYTTLRICQLPKPIPGPNLCYACKKPAVNVSIARRHMCSEHTKGWQVDQSLALYQLDYAIREVY